MFAGAIAAVAPVTAAPAAPSVPPAVPPVVVLPDAARTPSLSADGRLLVYAAAPADDDGRTSSIWLLDRSTGTTTELTRPLEGLRAGNSVRPAISADGCHVVAVTEIPYDLFRDDDSGTRWDVYQLTLPSCGGTDGAWELISSRAEDTFSSTAGDDADPDETPTISGSGTVVAYTRAFSAASAGAGVLGVAVVDRTIPLGQQGRTQPVAGSPAAAPSTTFRYHGLHEPAVSDDGRFVAFTADADAAAPVPAWSSGDVPGGFATSQVFVWDRQGSGAAAVSRVSSPAATVANGDGGHPAISHDGRFVAFESTATNPSPAPSSRPAPRRP